MRNDHKRQCLLPLSVLTLALSACAPMGHDRASLNSLRAPDESVRSMDNASRAVSTMAPAEAQAERFTLLPQSDGRPSALVITNAAKKESVLDKPYQQVAVDGDNLKPATVGNTGVNNRYVDTLAALPVATFTDLVRRTVLSNPEVQGRWHGLKRSRYERSEALSAFLPSVDFFASISAERFSRPGQPRVDQVGRSTSAVLTHNLYNGFADTNAVRESDHTILSRYYELLDISEEAAYEAARAHLDVERYTTLTKLAEDNLTIHGEFYDLIEERTRSGVDRRVDLELANGRLALAKSNLTTEQANLHDVSARYVRINGMRPVKVTGGLPATLDKMVPANLADGVRQALTVAPAVLAANEAALAAGAALSGSAAPFQPQVNFRAQVASANDSGSIEGNTKDSSMAVGLAWNLYRGNSDTARREMMQENLAASRYQHETACRSTRYTFEQAFLEYSKLNEQLPQLDAHRNATDKALQAYRQQFGIGQRTLLDVLDVQNEYFEAERAYINADYQHKLAAARLQQVSGGLLKALGVLPLTDQAPERALEERAADSKDLSCDMTASAPVKVDKEAALQEAMKFRAPRSPAPAPAPAAR